MKFSHTEEAAKADKQSKWHLIEAIAACVLTKEQDYDPELKALLGGCVIAYRASRGGFVLIDPTGQSNIAQQVAVFKGDMQRQQQHRTENRRRVPAWQALGDQMANNGDLEFANLCWQIKAEIEKTGDYSDGLISRFWQIVMSRDLVDA